MMRFVGAALVGLSVVSVASVLVARNISRDEALRDAIAQGRTFAQGSVRR